MTTSSVSIFKSQEIAACSRELSSLAKSLASANTTRRIVANTNGTFKRIINGEVIGKGIRGEINLIIIDALPEVSRIWYEHDYDPDAPPTLPNCFSNLGDVPEAGVPDPQHENCAKCPKNVKGSGKLGGRACRFQRRIAVLVEGDTSGEIYQFNVPAKSLFGKGVDNIHPFESYIKFLIANKQSPDNVVTNVSFDDNAETLELLFTPIREISDVEYDLVREAQINPECAMYTKLTVSQTDGVTKKPEVKEVAKEIVKEVAKEVTKKAAKIARSDEPDDDNEVIVEPTKRKSKSKDTLVASPADITAIVDQWTTDDDDA